MDEKGRIFADEYAMTQLREALGTAGEEYKHNLSRLTNLIRQITEGDIKGDLATEFKKKYEAKEETLQKLQNSINDAESYMGMKVENLQTTIADTQSDMN